MSQNNSRPLSKFNLVLAVLWLVDVVVTVAGYVILASSNATQAKFYTSQSADYNAYFTAQSGSGLGATLIGVGILGFIVTLAAQVVSRAIAKKALTTGAVREHDLPTTGSTPTVVAAAPTAAQPATIKPATDKPAAVKPAATPTDAPKGDEPHDGPKTAF